MTDEVDIEGLVQLIADLLETLDSRETPEAARVMLGGVDPISALGSAMNNINATSVNDVLPTNIRNILAQALETYNG